MSHAATIWAIQRKGMKAATKLLFLHLADRHNPDYGCFPSVARLAADCELSPASVKAHLNKLEAAGLIRREARKDAKTGRQMTTRYVLAFESDFGSGVPEAGGGGGPVGGDGPEGAFATDDGDDAQPGLPFDPSADLLAVAAEPRPESGHGSEAKKQHDPRPDSGEVRGQISHEVRGQILAPYRTSKREPVSEPCSSACADNHDARFDEFWTAHPRPRNRVRTRELFAGAVSQGTDPGLIISAAKRYASEQAGNAAMYVCQSDNWLINRRWEDFGKSDGHGVSQGQDMERLARFWAGKMAAGSYVPTSAISPRVAAEIVRLGLAGKADLARHGIWL
ncbi:MAG: helix-turn-helix domain-containing protein [Gemmobacter sp.]